MTDGDGTVTIVLKFTVDEDSIDEAKEKANQILHEGLGIPVNTEVVPGRGSEADPKVDERRSKDASAELSTLVKEYVKENKRELTVKAIKQGEIAISSSLKKGFGIVEDIYARMRSASPLLQSIESLFNLAMTLFFMPLGNKLGEVILPATIELVDNVVGLYEKFEGKSLGDILSIMLSEGVRLFANYFNDIGAKLKDQGGLLYGIGELLETLGAFIQGPGIAVLNTILGVSSYVLGHLKEFISLYIGLKTAELAMQATGALGWIGANAAIFTAAAAITAGGLSYLGMSAAGMASGGEVKATPGGQLRVIGEGGEDEYIVPKSQAPDFASKFGGSSAQIINNFYGYNEDQLIQKVNDTISQQISQSRLRSGI